MATLTQAQRRELDAIRGNLARSAAYLGQEDVQGIAHKVKRPEFANGSDYRIINPACTGPDWQGAAPAVTVVNKYIGSDIAGLYTALTQLTEFIARHDGRTQNTTQENI